MAVSLCVYYFTLRTKHFPHYDSRGAEPVEDGPVTVRKQPKVESISFLTEDGSGVFEGSAGFEGSAIGSPMADGSADYWTPLGKVDCF